MEQPITIVGIDGVRFARLAALKGAVSLEVAGMRHSSGRSMTQYARELYGIRGTKKQVLAHLEKMVEAAIAARKAGGE